MLATTQSQIIFDAKHKKAQTYKPAKTCDHKHHQEKHISPWSLYILIQFPLPTFHMGLNMLKKDNLLCFHLVRHVHFSDDFWVSWSIYKWNSSKFSVKQFRNRYTLKHVKHVKLLGGFSFGKLDRSTNTFIIRLFLKWCDRAQLKRINKQITCMCKSMFS